MYEYENDENKFRSLCGLMNEIMSGDTDVTPEEFEERVQEAYDNDEITGTQYDHLMGNF